MLPVPEPTPELYDSVYKRKATDNLVNRLDRAAIKDEQIASLDCTGFLSRGDLRRYKQILATNIRRDNGSKLKLLDLGCGVGQLGCWLAGKLGAALIGVDFSPVAIERARSLARKQKHTSRPRFRVSDFSATGLATSSVSAIISLDALYLATNRLAVLRELHRVLVSEGILLFTVYIRNSESKRTARKRALEWLTALEISGFEVVRCRDVSERWRGQMRKKHQQRWRERHRINAELGKLGEAELAVSAQMLGVAGKRSFLDSVSRFEILARSKAAAV